MKNLEIPCDVYLTGEQGEAWRLLGRYPIVVNFRTAKEIESGDVQYTNVSYTLIGGNSRCPEGGWRRAMAAVADDGRIFHVLEAHKAGRLWIIKAQLVLDGGMEWKER